MINKLKVFVFDADSTQRAIEDAISHWAYVNDADIISVDCTFVKPDPVLSGGKIIYNILYTKK